MKKLLLKTYKYWSWLLPSIYYPYRLAGGRVYLDISESRAMLARALGRYERAKQQAVQTLLPEGGTFIDVGVNKGDFTLLAARVVGESGRVLAFEPEPENCRWIAKSVARNAYRNIQLEQLALSDRNGEAELYLGTKSGWHSLVPGGDDQPGKTVQVSIRTLDDFLAKQGWERPVDMIKIDVEGADMQVLRGATRVLAENPGLVLLVDIHPEHGVNPQALCDYLRDRGFAIFREQAPFDIPVTDCGRVGAIVARRP